MALKDEASVLLSKEMDRKEFLKYIGFGLLAMTGLTAIIRAMTQQGQSTNNAAGGYGSSAYGGNKTSR